MSENNSDKRVRLNKLIADSGLASRRHADRMIEEGQVTVNGKRVYELGIKVDPYTDRIVVDGKSLKRPGQKIYIMLNKPQGILTTMEDPLGRPTVRDLLDEKVPMRVFPVGRLDWDSEGLLLLTNDGDFANRVMHPKAEVTKTYLVKLNGHPEAKHLDKLMRGVTIEGGRVAAKHLEKVRKPGENKSEKYDWFKIVITEGKNRQIRQMFEKVGFDVLRLQRVSIGRLRLGSLKQGELVFLNDVAIERVFQADSPDDVKDKKTYADRPISEKKLKTHKSVLAKGPRADRSTTGRVPRGERAGNTRADREAEFMADRERGGNGNSRPTKAARPATGRPPSRTGGRAVKQSAARSASRKASAAAGAGDFARPAGKSAVANKATGRNKPSGRRG